RHTRFSRDWSSDVCSSDLVLEARARERNSAIGVLMPFGLGLGILFLSLYDGRSANRFSLLTGQIVSVQTGQLGWLIAIGAVVLRSEERRGGVEGGSAVWLA